MYKVGMIYIPCIADSPMILSLITVFCETYMI